MIRPVRSHLSWIKPRIRLVEVLSFCAFLIVAGFCSPSWAADYTASSCSASAIQSLIDNPSVVDGDRIIIPPGSCTWGPTDTLAFRNKAVTVRGAGALVDKGANGQVIITVQTNAATERTIDLGGTGTSAKRARLSNITFTDAADSDHGVWMITLLGDPIIGTYAGIIDHLTVNLDAITDVIHVFGGSGVIYRNIFQAPAPGASVNYHSQHAAVRCKYPGLAPPDARWARMDTFGTADATGDNQVYFETNDVYYMPENDVDDGCKMVFRYNTFTNSAIASHGNDSSATGARAIEVYNNVFQCAQLGDLSAWIYARGGVWVVTDNVLPRSTLCALGGPAYPTAAGVGVWVLNSGGTSCYAGPYPARHQVGWGWSGGSVDDQVLDPSYYWNNTDGGGGAADAPSIHQPVEGWACQGCACTVPGTPQDPHIFLQLNREGFLSAKPGYAKYTYPHPLASE